MGWYEDAENEAAKLKAQSDSRNMGAEVFFNDLWGEIKKGVHEVLEARFRAGDKLSIGTNGSPRDRVVFQHVMLPNEQVSRPRELHIKLINNEQITATAAALGSFASISVTLSIGVGDDNVTYLAHDGKKLNTQEAATRILRKFFFPTLP
jgi:hypothetical protein